MAAEYHLITPFGTGKTATMTIASPCVVTYTAHGLADGNPVVFTTSGALPTGVVSGTTYYTRSTGANTFNLYDTKLHALDTGNTTGRVNTSGSQSGTHTITGGFWYNLPTSDPGGGGNYKNRYKQGATYYVFAGIYNWENDGNNWTTRANYKTTLVVEFQGKWNDTSLNGYSPNNEISGFYSVTLTTKVNGAYDPDSYHHGMLSGGYVLNKGSSAGLRAAVNPAQPRVYIDGLEIIDQYSSGYAVYTAIGTVVKNCILKGTNGVYCIGGGEIIYNNLVHDCSSYGIYLPDYKYGGLTYNNTVVGCGTGMYGGNSVACIVVGNVAYGNTTNWGSAPVSGWFNNNAGASGNSVWVSASPAVKITTIVSGDFKNYVVPATTASDFSPSGDSVAHTSSSHLVDVASQEFSDLQATAINNSNVNSGDPRPSYKNGSATDWDVGAFEFDWGYGLAPATVTVAISGIVSGSRLRVEKASDNSLIHEETVSGTSVSFSYSYTSDTLVNIIIRKSSAAPKYKPFKSQQTIGSSGLTLSVSQEADSIVS